MPHSFKTLKMIDMNEQNILIKAIMIDLMMMCEEYKENEPIHTRLYHIKQNVIDLDKITNSAEQSDSNCNLQNVSGMCEHNNTEFKHIRCNCCNDCGEIIEIDV